MAKGTGEAGENPLVPNAKLRQMYTAMLEARMLEDAVTKKARGKKGRISSIRGQEAVRVSTAIELGVEDLISDVAPSAGMGLILGGEPASLLKRFSGSKLPKTSARAADRLLPVIPDTEERLRVAVGAAAALKAQRRGGVVVAYTRAGEISNVGWRRVLGPAAKLELPMIFVVLPQTRRTQNGGSVTAACHATGVPGMSVDVCDAVALYRVTQESLGRTRACDGPVLIECVAWHVEGKRTASDDPLEHLKAFLLERKICTPAWFDRTQETARKPLLAKRRASKNQ
jgi:Pyruvate/2-oxoglutarate dehydrogenase complex, dehydrogenase (E1) component, eukaryotic type, alpha subunit